MVTVRKFPLVSGEVYHIFNKSIADYKIFNQDSDFERMRELFKYYRWGIRPVRFSRWKEVKEKDSYQNGIVEENKLVEIIAYCIMPTHIHLVLKQLKDRGISIFMSQLSLIHI